MADIAAIEAQLGSLRLQAKSGLQNQQQVAATLLAVEETLREQSTDLKPSAYFATLYTLLEQQHGIVADNGIAASTLYLLKTVLPGVPNAVVRSKTAGLLRALSPYLDPQAMEAPVLRSAQACLHAALMAQDETSWRQPTIKQHYQTLLLLAVDSRPKVRREAQDAVKTLIQHCTQAASSTGVTAHPLAGLTTKFCLRLLQECVTASEPKTTTGLLHLIQHTAALWSLQALDKLIEVLVPLAKGKHQYVTTSVLETALAFLTQFTKAAHKSSAGSSPSSLATTTADSARAQTCLALLLETKPTATHTDLMRAWLKVVTRALVAFCQCYPRAALGAITGFYDLLFSELELGAKPETLVLVTNALITLAQECVPCVLAVDTSRETLDTLVGHLATIIARGMGYRYRESFEYVCHAFATMVKSLGSHASPHFNEALQTLGDIRMQSEFEYQPQADQVIKAAIRALGPEQFLSLLPLNLVVEPLSAESTQTATGRAWLLPLLKDGVGNADLGYFTRTLLPLIQTLDTTAKSFQAQDKDLESKIYQTLVHQLWALFPGFCTGPTDVVQAFTPKFAETLGEALYQLPELRPTLCGGLKTLILKLQAVEAIGADQPETNLAARLTPATAQASLAHLAQFAANYLGVLFNLYSSLAPGNRDFVLQAIEALVTIAPIDDMTTTFTKIDQILTQQLPADLTTMQGSFQNELLATMLELCLPLVTRLPESSLNRLYQQTLPLLLFTAAPLLQKKAYRILHHMLAHPTVGPALIQAEHTTLVPHVVGAVKQVTPSAKRDRLAVLNALVRIMPASDLSWAPAILSETILGTKEVNDRTRQLTYELGVTMARRMYEQQPADDGAMDTAQSTTVVGADGTPVDLSLEGFFAMVSAGLTSQKAYMVSATLAMLAALLFEFKAEFQTSSSELPTSLMDTVQLFAQTQQPEVAKAGLNLVKVAVLVLSDHQLEPYLETTLATLLQWSDRHRAHVRLRVRHLIERLARKFTFERIEGLCPAEHVKLMTNIKKRWARAKRVKALSGNRAEAHGSDGAATESLRPGFANAYEQAIYGSDSEDGDTDDDDDGVAHAGSNRKDRQANAKGRQGRGAKANNTWIREQQGMSQDGAGDQPLDFLDQQGVHAQLTNVNPELQRARSGAARKPQFAMDEQGKYIIEDPVDRLTTGAQGEDDAMDTENYYLEAQTSKDGFKRVGNRIKFHKRKAGDEDPFADSDHETQGNGQQPLRTTNQASRGANGAGSKRLKIANSKSAPGPQIGKAYRSGKASGDMKKAGKHDPFAYIPLNPRQKTNVSIINKSKNKRR
ncbi:pre-rRNA processing protein [Dimargaris xerosporica]|nr:pre-rRNA processing protein [Dimargaris xerosporica]